MEQNRIVVLIDMDCFYCQVEEKLNPELKGKPIAVVQYNPWKGGGIIAVNYVARAMGVTRHMRGDEAKEKCPEIELPSVPCQRGKADISKYRDAGKEVARVLQKFTTLLERASIDEAYLDITYAVQERLKTVSVHSIKSDMMPNTYVLGYDSINEFIHDIHSCSSDSIDFDYENVKQLLVGAVIVSEIRTAVYQETGYRCSAGIAHNKILAKLICGMNKPNKQTILPKHSVTILYETLPIKKVKHLGGKFGEILCEKLKIKNMGELRTFTEKELQTKFDEKNGTWLYNIARGIDLEAVQAKFNSKSIGCCKQFRGKAALTSFECLRNWLKDLGDEIEDRLEKDALETNRTPKQMVVSFSIQLSDGRDTSSSRSYNFQGDVLCGEFFSNKALELILDSTGVKPKDGEISRQLKAPIKFLGISVGKFEDNSESKKTKKIVDYFGNVSKDVRNTIDVPVDKIACLLNDSNRNKGNDNKNYILQRFFQEGNKDKSNKSEEFSIFQTNNKILDEQLSFKADLDNRESFFVNFLKEKKPESIVNEDGLIPTTSACNTIQSNDDSNDTNYSGSTINMEINKSIAIFEEDHEVVERVSNIRNLLKKSTACNEDETNNEDNNLHHENSPQASQMFDCPECGKTLPVNTFDMHKDYHLTLKLKKETLQDTKEITDKNNRDTQNYENDISSGDGSVPYFNNCINNVAESNVKTFRCQECGKTVPENLHTIHSDYHLALKLREEDRRESQDKKGLSNKIETNMKLDNNVNRMKQIETTTSISSFLMKIDSSVPTETCSECKKKVPLDKFIEHLDFHEAQRVSRKLNKCSTNVNTPSNFKRKRKAASPIKKSKLPFKSIDSFFR